MVILIFSNISIAQGTDVSESYLDGVGLFESSTSTGIWGASFAGGMEVQFMGSGMSHTAQDLYVVYTSTSLGFSGFGTDVTQDNAFRSSTQNGKLQYTTPSVMDLLGIDYEDINSYDYLSFTNYLINSDSSTGEVSTLSCTTSSYCTYVMSRWYTPILYYMVPPVAYYGSEVTFVVDPRSAQNYKSSYEMPFTEARIDSYTIDFEGFVDEDTTLSTYTKNFIRGKVGKVEGKESTTVNFKFKAGNAIQTDQMLHCSYDNETCYTAKTLPVVQSISADSGYKTGGQILTFWGHGFNSDNIQVSVDGVSCSVQSYEQGMFTCLTGENSSPSSDTYYVGQQGLRRKIYNATTSMSYSLLSSLTNYTEELALSLQAQYGYKDPYYGNIYSGYFVPPATTDYRFYMACDDQCTMYLSNVNKDPSQKTVILQQTSWTSYREYFTADESKVSDWVSLTEGEYYYLEVQHIQSSGGDHLTVSVEIDSSPVSPHHHSMKEIQRLQIDNDYIRELSTITITNPDGGYYKLYIQNPDTKEYYETDSISTTASASTLYYAIYGYYSSAFSASISVERVMYDSSDVETTDSTLATKYVYTITVKRSISQASTKYISIVKSTTTSTIAIGYPTNIQLSSAPLTGTFYISCYLESGSLNYTTALSATASISTISSAITTTCPQFREKIEIWEGDTYSYTVDGRDIYIRFVNLNYDIPQLTIIDNAEDPLTASVVTVTSSTMVPYGGTLFYEPIPYEFIRTDESAPQVLVTVDGIKAACSPLNCSYSYFDATAQITGHSLSGTTLTITGTDLPTSDIQEITFSNLACSVTSSSSTQIQCTLESSAVAGSWVPTVRDSYGSVPYSSSTPTSVSLTVSSVSQSTGLNPYGGNEITIYGTGFPSSLDDGNSVSVIFGDTIGTCTISSVSSTEIVCTTTAFSAYTTTTSIIVTVNSIEDSSLSVTMDSGPAEVTAISPNTASPVLKTNLTLIIENFGDTLTTDDLTVTLIQQANTSITKAVNVIEVYEDGSYWYAVLRFGGAYSGTYDLQVQHATYGYFSTSGVSLSVIGTVTSFTPTSGSAYGGTLITITGYTFSTDITDNPVQIGDTDCYVQTSSSTEITCRTEARSSFESVTEDLIVFLKTSEEAVCCSCSYTWLTTSLPTLTSYSVAYDSTYEDYVLTLTGTGFSGSTSEVELYIDDTAQTVLSVSSTQVKVQITDMLDSSSSNVDFYLPEGTPEGFDVISSISLTPLLMSVSPSIGSPGGSLITAVVKGVGTDTSSVTLTTSSGTDICDSVSITSYGEVQCYTTATTVSSTTLKVKVGTTSYSCSGTCTYATSSSSMPSVSSISKTDTQTITFTGSNFFTSSYTAKSSFNGVDADTVTVDSDTQVTAVWTYGVPLSLSDISPELYFVSDSSDETHWASISATLTNSQSVSSISSAVSCSFAGGCLLSISQTGLYSSLLNEDNYISVCEKTCEFSADDSSLSTVKCYLPALATIYSIENYKINSEDYIMGTPFSSNSLYTDYLFDMDNVNGFADTSSDCYFGTAFDEGYVGVITEVKYFMNRFTSSNYIDNLSFQGSDDGSTYTTIFTVGNEIHEGWNYVVYDEGSELKYRYYRFYGAAAGSCVVGEIGLRGYEAIDDSSSSYSCSATLNIDSTTISLTGSITYTSTKTPLLTDISPRFGTVLGGESIVFTGDNFSSTIADYTILLDDVECEVTAATSTSVTCTTGARTGLLPDPTVDIKISGYGSVATQELVFRYVYYWSDETTWGGEFQPMEGESVWIPAGLHLLVDVDSTPILGAILVEGSLIFAPDDDNSDTLKTFDAQYIMVKEGYMEVGTEDFPYTSKLIITMHGTRDSPELPTYGNKVIAVRDGTLDMHGVERSPTWTELYTTASAGATSITLNTAVDWAVGEEIVIAPSGYDNYEAEVRTIVSIDRSDSSKPVLTLDSALAYKHYAGIQTFGSDTLEMRAEVGLLTRNVVFRGDPETSSLNQYGAHIMLHSHGDESLTGRIEYCEFEDVGQAFQLGRYPIHFHMIGTVHKSYIIGNSIHNTYNRAVTIHGVHYLRIIENVAYNTMGHTFFIEDAAETKNYLEKNLAVLTKASWSLLNTDQTPASFWITHPDNIFRGNHAAGSDRYGYWFDTQEHSTGPSYDENICPENAPLGEFTDNVAHSNGRYGLRIFHKLIPRTYPCEDIVYDETNTADPYWQNPLITASFENFVGWKNNRNGAIAEQVGDVRFINFKVADNLLAGIEFSLTDDVEDGYAQIDGALVVGYSDNADSETLSSDFHGIITPRTENFQVHNVNFYNFDLNDMAALGSCSHCFHSASTDSGARTVKFSGLYFDSSVSKKIKYQFPYRDIFLDLDGTLTGLGSNTWATPYWQHNYQPECTYDEDVYNGLICDDTVEIRRLAFYNYLPDIFSGQEFRIIQYDDSIIGSMTDDELTTYEEDTTLYSYIPFKALLDPNNGWAIPFVTGKKYKVHWQQGLDFTQMQIDLSSRWETTDQNVYLVFNFTDVRAQVDVTTGGDVIANTTLLTKTEANWQTGDNVVYNDTSVREIHLLINGVNETRDSVLLEGYRCIGSCLSAVDEVPIEDEYRRWSNASSWDSGAIPVAGETVEIQSGWNMLYDIGESPILEMVQINGRLTFEDGTDQNLQAKYVFIRAGELIIGTQDQPFNNNAQITLYGEKENASMVYDNAIEAGNKILANTGKVSIYGQARNTISRLKASVYEGDSVIYVDTDLDWEAGDKIGLAPTGMRHNHSDYAIISSYDSSTGKVTLDRELSYYHYGDSVSTASLYSGVDIRGEVFLLNRNVKITAEDVENWGCQIVTSDFLEVTGVYRYGNTIMDNVEIHNCSQYDTQKASLRFDGAAGKWSSITNSVIHHGIGRAVEITNSENILLQNNIIFDFIRFGINIGISTNITVDSNLVSHITKRTLSALDKYVEGTSGIVGCALEGYEPCYDISIVNNIVAGTYGVGIAAFAHECGDYDTPVFKNNIVHSVDGVGAVIFKNASSDDQASCLEGSYFTAYKCTEDGALTYDSNTTEAIFTNMIFIDNRYAGTVMIGQEGDSLTATLQDSIIYGETLSRDCDEENACDDDDTLEGCIDKGGLQVAYFSKSGKDPFPTSSSSLPLHKIKSDASFGGQIYYDNITLQNFNSSTTWCGMNQSAISLNTYGADYFPKAKFTSTKFVNVEQDALAFLFSPPSWWANIDDCGNFPCTAPYNVLLWFEKSTFSGKYTPAKTNSNFQIIGNNLDSSKNFSSCTFVKGWNAYYCQNEDLSILLFESLDSDSFDRTVTPIYVTNAALSTSNKLNTFMDHIWDGFYTGQLRKSRWPSIIQTGTGYTHQIYYTGTPPSNQRFYLNSEYTGTIIYIKYPKAGSYLIKDSNGNIVTANSWSDTLQAPAAISTNPKCGENRFQGVVNILEFYLKPDCMIYIESYDSIQSKIRMDWTLSEFYADGGTTKFIDRMAASLGIHASTIKVVSVYQGSVIVQFMIVDPYNTTTSMGGLTAVKTKLTQQIKNNKLSLGAPILSADIGTTTITVNSTSSTNNGGTTTNGGNNGNNGGTNTGGNNSGGNSNGGSNNGGNGGVNYNSTTTIDIKNQQAEQQKQIMIIAIVSVIIGLIVVGGVIGYFIYKKHSNKPQLTTPVKAVNQNDGSSSAVHSPGEDESYEPQYHPKAEIGNIFLPSNAIAKANNADIVQSIKDISNENGVDEEVNNFKNYTQQSVLDCDGIKENTPLQSLRYDSGRDFTNQLKLRNDEELTMAMKVETTQKDSSLYDL